MDDLDNLLCAYRDALPDPEPSPDFTPGVWRRIEARRSPIRMLKRMAEALVAVAALVTLLVGTLLIPRLQNSPVYSATSSYVDVLAAENSSADFAEVHSAPVGEAVPR